MNVNISMPTRFMPITSVLPVFKSLGAITAGFIAFVPPMTDIGQPSILTVLSSTRFVLIYLAPGTHIRK